MPLIGDATPLHRFPVCAELRCQLSATRREGAATTATYATGVGLRLTGTRDAAGRLVKVTVSGPAGTVLTRGKTLLKGLTGSAGAPQDWAGCKALPVGLAKNVLYLNPRPGESLVTSAVCEPLAGGQLRLTVERAAP